MLSVQNCEHLPALFLSSIFFLLVNNVNIISLANQSTCYLLFSEIVMFDFSFSEFSNSFANN